MSYERLVLVTRETEQDALVARFQTRSQAEFYLNQSGDDFAPIAERHQRYQAALQQIRSVLPPDLKVQVLERRDLPRYQFSGNDVVVALGPDGLVANIAKYLRGQPLIAVNPDPESIDGVLLPVSLRQFAPTVQGVLRGRMHSVHVTMTEAVTSDGQRLRAVNDLFIGARSHVSVRYRIEHRGCAEEQSSSGLIVSTGVGSTGWLRSIYAGAIAITQSLEPSLAVAAPAPLPWDTRELLFHVREPWPSLHTRAEMVCGRIQEGQALRVTSRMAVDGVIFGDGMERDFLTFNSGAQVAVGCAEETLQLVQPVGQETH